MVVHAFWNIIQNSEKSGPFGLNIILCVIGVFVIFWKHAHQCSRGFN